MPSFFFHIAVDLQSCNPASKSLHSRDIFKPHSRDSPRRQKSLAIGIEQNSTEQTSKVDNSRSVSDNSRVKSVPESEEEPNGHENSLSTDQSYSPFDDWRLGKICLQHMEMLGTNTAGRLHDQDAELMHLSHGIGAGPNGLATKGRYEPSAIEDEELGWGVVRLYRDVEETPGLYEDPLPAKSSKHGKSGGPKAGKDHDRHPPFRDEDCTTLCILAVPSYLTPSDFLGFVGEKTREEVSHFRMIRTERSNRYMVLMKFRHGRKAREWRKEWNGKVFNSMESENCHVVFVKSIEFRLPTPNSSFPDMTNDPFTPSSASKPSLSSPSTHSKPPSTLHPKPIPPPTPSLVELPTCPVCLERMDESTGLLTIQCQHVFHCTCLRKWRGGGCPVCRYSHSPFPHAASSPHHASFPKDDPAHPVNECHICHSDANLWICLICGSVGCGRYDAAHAFLHYSQSGHPFAMDLASARVWDYAGDGYVHRILQDQADGKLVELTPSRRDHHHHHDEEGIGSAFPDDASGAEWVPRGKLERLGVEYTSLLTSQLESQRTYFEAQLELAADKTSEALAGAREATRGSAHALEQLAALRDEHRVLVREALPATEKERDRARRRADHAEKLSQRLDKEWREEQAFARGLRERVEGLGSEVAGLRQEVQVGRERIEALREENRDLLGFISAGEQVRGLGAEVQGGTVWVVEKEKEKEKEEGGVGGEGGGGKGKRKGKGKK